MANSHYPELISKERLDGYPVPFLKENYPDLFSAIERDSLIIFVGAGVSKLLGCSLWNELAIEIARKTNVCSHAEIDILEKEAMISPRKVISICYGRCKDDEERFKLYKNTINEALIVKDIDRAKSLYSKIFSLDPKAYITTNIDLGIIDAVPEVQKPEVYDCTCPEDLLKIRVNDFNVLKDGNIIFLHGTLKNIEKAIFPVEKYLEHYNEKIIIDLLKSIFREGNIMLFIGYSLTEWEIIERIYRLIANDNKIKSVKTGYLLTPLYSHEYTKYVLDKDYYSLFNIEIIPYFIDYGGYEKVEAILEKLSRAADKHKPSPFEIFGEIEDAARQIK